jgi:SAM-dependent methyltransferase
MIGLKEREVTMLSDESKFWDERFKDEGAIWGEGASVTAQTATRHLAAGARLLEIGFGYGRDLAFLAREGYRVSGIDLSSEARRRTEARLGHEGLPAERLWTGRFEESDVPESGFDGVVSHRMAHLLVSDQAVERYVQKASRILRPGGILCLGVRNSDDIIPGEVRHVRDIVYDYLPRPGHRIRYWNDDRLRRAFGKRFNCLALEHACEDESQSRPVPCRLTILVARKRENPESLLAS